MLEDAFIKQAKRNIDLLLASKKYNEAYDLCMNILNKLPNATEIINIKKYIENIAEESNKDYLNKKIKELESLWKEEKYEEILSSLKYLLKISPNHPKLIKLYEKAQKNYLNKISDLKQKYYNEQENKLDTLLKTDPEKLLSQIFILEKTNQNNSDILRLAKKYREMLVNKKIKDKQDLINSEKLEVFENFIKELKVIDNQNEEIKKLEKLLKEKLYEKQIEDKKEYIYKGEKYLITLYQKKKFDEAIKVAEELLKIDKKNKLAQKLKNNSKRKSFNQKKENTIDLIIKDLPKLKAEYKNNKNNFIKI